MGYRSVAEEDSLQRRDGSVIWHFDAGYLELPKVFE